jgi:prevent-host-death family protein
MTTVGMHAAKSQLSKLVAQAEAGEEVIITRGDKPVARIVPFEPQPMRGAFGLYKGQFPIDDRFFEPLPDDELKAWNGE